MREERWGALAEEKREVLVSMQEVLRSCHTLLNTTQIPMNGVVNLLQHILRRAAPRGRRPSPPCGLCGSGCRAGVSRRAALASGSVSGR
jgi:hypothetical protein